MTITPISSFNHYIHGAIPKEKRHCSEEVIIQNLENNQTKPIENHLKSISNDQEKALAIKSICSKALEGNYLEVVPNMISFLLKNNMTETIDEIIKICTKGTQIELELLNSITFSALQSNNMNTIEHILSLPLEEDNKLLIIENQFCKIAKTAFFKPIKDTVDFLLKKNKGVEFLCSLLKRAINILVFQEIASHCISRDSLKLFKYIEKSNLYDQIYSYYLEISVRDAPSIMEYIVSRPIKYKEKKLIPIIFNYACENQLSDIIKCILNNPDSGRAISSENIIEGLSIAVRQDNNLGIVQVISSHIIQNPNSNEKYSSFNFDEIKNILYDALGNQHTDQSIKIIDSILDILINIPKSNTSLTKTELDSYLPLILSLPEKTQKKILEFLSEILFSKSNKMGGKERDEFLTSLIEKNRLIKFLIISNQELMEKLKKCNSLALELL